MSKAVTKAILKQCDSVSDLLRSLAHPVRLKVLCTLMDGEKSVSDLTDFCEISQSAMSQFLQRMRDEGLVEPRREGTRMFYKVANPKVARLLGAIKEIYC